MDIKSWESMSIEELENELIRLKKMTFEHEWQNEFNKMEIFILETEIKNKKEEIYV